MEAVCIYPNKISRLVTYIHNHDRRPCKRWDTPNFLSSFSYMRRLGFVKLLRLRRSSGKRVPLLGPTRPLGGPFRTCNFRPTRESLPHLFAVLQRGQQMPSGAEVLGNGTIRGQKALGMTCRLKPLHAIFALPRRPVRILTAVVQITTLAVFDAGQDLALGRAVALELIGDDHPWYILEPLEQLTKKLLRRLFVASALHQNVEHVIVLIHCTPQVMALPVNRQKDLVQVPLVPWLGASTP